jgi:formate hydrogenlyase subunit 6/NADH:ubiquinone oxidoreductase subunit I
MKHPGWIFPEVMSMLMTKAATLRYPAERPAIPEHFRGKIAFDQKLCIGCNICMRDCPSKAVVIEKTDQEKVFKATFFLDRCIFCAQCVDSCPRKALASTKSFELAHYNRKALEDHQG